MSLLEGFLTHLESCPQATCLRDGECQLTYQQIALRAGGIARKLTTLSLPADRPVGVALPRGIEATCTVLGILAAGHSYLPLDMKSPFTRRQWILGDAGAVAIIGKGHAEKTSVPVFDVETIDPAPLSPVPVHPETLAAILYTSGSTGAPKGVALSHRAIRAFSDWARQLVSLNQDDRIAAIAPLHFDLSTFDLFAVLSSGASLDFVPEGLTAAPSRLSSWLAGHSITGFYTVPSLLSFWSWKGNLPATPLPALRFLLFAGEPFPTSRLRLLAEAVSHVDLYNLYGPTETNVCCHWAVIRERLNDAYPIPIGHPACGDELHIDPSSSELWVRGPTLLSGYWQRGQVHPALNEKGWYATGDRVSLTAQGEYVYCGRLDRMLKVSGHRVEPAEIEAALLELADVLECAVVGINEPGGIRPAAAVVLKSTASIQSVRHRLRESLPTYMLPGKFEVLPRLPRLSNGKPDLETIRCCFFKTK